MTADPWPKSIPPGYLDNRRNRLLDLAATAYRALADGDQLVSMRVTLLGRDGTAAVVVTGPDGARRLTVSDESAEVDEVAGWLDGCLDAGEAS